MEENEEFEDIETEGFGFSFKEETMQDEFDKFEEEKVVCNPPKSTFYFVCECSNRISQKGLIWDSKKAWHSAICNDCGAEVYLRFKRRN